jgi:hypothetical protein
VDHKDVILARKAEQSTWFISFFLLYLIENHAFSFNDQDRS